MLVADSSAAAQSSLIAIPGRMVEDREVTRISWRSGEAELMPQTPIAIAQSLDALAQQSVQHLIVQLVRPVDATARAALKDAGIELLDYLGNDAFFAAIAPKGSYPPIDASNLGLRAVSAIDASWKMHPSLVSGDPPEWIVVPPPSESDDDPRAAIYVLLHSDVDAAAAIAAVRSRHGATIRSRLRTINAFVIEIPVSALRALADEDAVQWIEPALPPLSETNDGNRELTQAAVAQAPPYSLTGAGVRVLVYDVGRIDADHPDFASRVISGDDANVSPHSTHCAGSVAGDGYNSDGLYRGMAPNAELLSYGIGGIGSGLPLYSDPGDLESDYFNALHLYGFDIATNSIGTNTCRNGYSCDITGNYGVTSAVIDGMVRGGLGQPLIVLFANGNERSCQRCRDEGVHTPEGYHSTAPPACAKNHISVGAVNSDDDQVTFFTSWGPTDDGRLKPDICGPGCQLTGDEGVTSTVPGGGYTAYCGTSMATPTTAGLCALLLEDLRTRRPDTGRLLNSTMKILLCHNAFDLGLPGPDYQSGYGSARIVDTIDFARQGNFFERAVDQGGENTFLLRVLPGESELKVTLAWDDLPGTANILKALINDLDLVVIDPQARRHYPWTLDPGNPGAPAARDRADHLNVIEQVFVENPEAGLWTVSVLAYNVPVGPQYFSICGSPRLAPDCDGNQIPDDEEIAGDPSLDCTANGILDLCEPDCNGNSRADSCDIADGTSPDCDGNGVPDECQPDCNGNGLADACDILEGISDDCDGNGVPDECQDTSADCNDNGVWDACDIADGSSIDLNFNWIPDECEQPRTIYVDDDAPGDPVPGNAVLSDPLEDGTAEHPFDGIQEALDAALSGDTIIVADGLYTWLRNTDLNFRGKQIVLRSANGPANCVIDGEGSYRGFTFVNGETAAARIEGFTIRDGFDGFWGGAMFCENSSPTIVNCVFEENWAVVGGALYLRAASPVIRDCAFFDNFGGYGGGIFTTGASNPRISDCVFYGNISLLGGSAATFFGAGPTRVERCEFSENRTNVDEGSSPEGGALLIQGDALLTSCLFRDNLCQGAGGAVYLRAGSTTTIMNSAFTRNNAQRTFSDGGALALIQSNAVVIGCTFLGNTADREGGGIILRRDARLSLSNSILWNNRDRSGYSQTSQLKNGGLFPRVRYCCIQNYDGLYGQTAIISADPSFVDAEAGDFHLLPDSPCINRGDPTFLPLPDEIDADGDPRVLLERVDLGADEFRYELIDCDANGIPDAIEIADDPGRDCNANGVLDFCESAWGWVADCNGNGRLDDCDLLEQASFDCGDGVPDECASDCNGNGIADDCDIVSGASSDCNGDWIPDECQPDCNGDGRADDCDLYEALSDDFNNNSIPDECEENRIIHVDDDAPHDPGPGTSSLSDPLEDGTPEHPFDSIQKAVNAAISGDEILVADGVYAGAGNKNITFYGRQLTVRSTGGPYSCIINCEDYGRGFLLGRLAGPQTLVEGFTITNGAYSIGGGIYCQRSSATVRRCILVGNSSWHTGHSGSGIAMSQSNALIENCLIVGNVGHAGGGIDVEGGANPRIINCTIANNSAVLGGGLCASVGANLLVANTVLWGNTAGAGAQLRLFTGATTLTVSHCLVQGGQADVDGDGAARLIWASGNVVADPLFRTSFGRVWGGTWTAAAVYDPVTRTTTLYDAQARWLENELADLFLQPSLESLVQGLIVSNTAETITVWGDYDSLGLPGTEYRIHDYHPRNCSPCIDAGDNEPTAWLAGDTDLDGRARRIDDPRMPDTGSGLPPLADLGAYEYPADCPGDLTGDRIVNLADLLLLLQNYGVNDLGDLNCDAATDLNDLADILGAYGMTCP